MGILDVLLETRDKVFQRRFLDLKSFSQVMAQVDGLKAKLQAAEGELKDIQGQVGFVLV